jgi:hypothetical protein
MEREEGVVKEEESLLRVILSSFACVKQSWLSSDLVELPDELYFPGGRVCLFDFRCRLGYDVLKERIDCLIEF